MNADVAGPPPLRPAVLLQERVTRRVLRAYYDVYNELGGGFLEAVYAGAFAIACADLGLKVEREVPVPVFFRGYVVGEYRVDALIESVVLVELKATRGLDDVHVAQLVNYLRATQLEVGILLNFGPKPQFRRIVMANDRKAIRVHPRKSAVPPAEPVETLDAPASPAPR